MVQIDEVHKKNGAQWNNSRLGSINISSKSGVRCTLIYIILWKPKKCVVCHFIAYGIWGDDAIGCAVYKRVSGWYINKNIDFTRFAIMLGHKSLYLVFGYINVNYVTWAWAGEDRHRMPRIWIRQMCDSFFFFFACGNSRSLLGFGNIFYHSFFLVLNECLEIFRSCLLCEIIINIKKKKRNEIAYNTISI